VVRFQAPFPKGACSVCRTHGECSFRRGNRNSLSEYSSNQDTPASLLVCGRCVCLKPKDYEIDLSAPQLWNKTPSKRLPHWSEVLALLNKSEKATLIAVARELGLQRHEIRRYQRDKNIPEAVREEINKRAKALHWKRSAAWRHNAYQHLKDYGSLDCHEYLEIEPGAIAHDGLDPKMNSLSRAGKALRTAMMAHPDEITREKNLVEGRWAAWRYVWRPPAWNSEAWNSEA